MHSNNLHPYPLAESWFRMKDRVPHDFQRETWAAIGKGRSGLLNAPTGYGKTLAVWFGVVQHYYDSRQSVVDSRQLALSSRRLHCLWITPLRALSKEIHKAATEVSEDLQLDYEIGLRTGDTSVKERLAQKSRTPQALITTPESVHILLASKNYPEFFKDLQFVVVDEWHELMGSKRGVLTELALSRLKAINPRLKIWGISATIGNLGLAMEILLGSGHRGKLVRAALAKQTEIQTILPDTLETFPWAGHLGVRLADKVLPVIEQGGSTLLFTNTRSQAEIWYQRLLDLQPSLAGAIALHHGSLSEEIRQWVEEALHKG